MKTFFSGITMVASLAALALSGLAFMKVTTLESELPEKIVAALPESPVGEVDTPISQTRVSEVANTDTANTDTAGADTADADNEGANDPDAIESGALVEAVEIQPGEFSQLGYDNQVKMEIVSVTRLPADEDGSRQRVNVNLRARRTVEEPTSAGVLVIFSSAKGRNSQTNEVYPAIPKQRTSAIQLTNLSTEAWGDAYVWLDNVPEDINAIDIVLPKMAVFNDVPIAD